MTREEQEQQIAVVQWAKLQECVYPPLRWLHHIPNGGGRSKAEGGILKAMGVKRGICDLFLPCARGGYHGLYIEMKTQSGRASDEQDRFISFAQKEGYCVYICRSAAEAIEKIKKYIGGTK